MEGHRASVTLDLAGVNPSGSWVGNQVSESARVHQGHVFNITTRDPIEEACFSLLFSDYEGGKNRNAKRAPGTCKWVLDHDKFIRWRDSPASGALWISADPGCGKSVLSRALVDEGLVQSCLPEAQPSIVCYFFFKDDDASRKTSEAALRGLLYQIFRARRSLINHMTARYDQNKGPPSTSMAELWGILESVAGDVSAGPIVCILDALDECGETSRGELIDHITEFIASDRGQTAQLKFIMTSRPYPEIEWEFRCNLDDLDIINVRGDEDSYRTINSEVNLFIETQVPKLFRRFRHRPSDSVQKRVIAELQGRDNRTYLWVSLVLNDLVRTRLSQEDEILDFINHVPRNLDTTYGKLVGRILPQHERAARSLFHIILAATTPLHIRQLYPALVIATRKSGQGGRLEMIPKKEDDEVTEYLKTISGNFVSILDHRVYLLHQTARDFLVATDGPGITPQVSPTHKDGIWIRGFKPTDSHALFARTCMTSLLFEDYNQKEVEYYNQALFFHYAARSWVSHLLLSDFGSRDHTDDLLGLAEKVCRMDSTPRSKYLQSVHQVTSVPLSMDSRAVSALFEGGDPLSQFLLNQGGFNNIECLKCIVSHVRSQGQLVTLSRLLRLNVDTETMAALALRIAVEISDLGLVKLLLLTPRPGPGVQGALHVACFLGDLPIASCLMDQGHATPSAQALCLAVSSRMASHEMIKTLVKQYGVGPNEKWNGQTAIARLMLCSWHEREAKSTLLQLLISLGADPNCTCGPGSALEMAISKGNHQVAAVLIKAGANLSMTSVPICLKWQSDLANPNGAYDWAGTDAILDQATNTLDPADHIRQRELLSNIIQHCPDDERAFKYITKLQTSVNHRDTYNWTPLMEAAYHDKTKILDFLITLGADVNNTDKWGRTELMFTSKRDMLEAAIILVSAGADVDQADSDGVTALRYAIGGRAKGVCLFLLSIGADF